MAAARLTGFVLLPLLFTVSTATHAEIVWRYDAEREFTAGELYMMENCGTCSELKSFSPVDNPPGVPILRDAYATNNRVAEMVFPGCQHATSENFCMKCMSQPEGQSQVPYGTDVWHAFSIFVPAGWTHPAGDWGPLVYQWHAHPDDVGNCDIWRSPPLAIFVDSGGPSWYVDVRGNSTACQTVNGPIVYHASTPLAKGGWSHFVIHARFDWADDGDALLEIWLKDLNHAQPELVFSHSGQMGYNDALPPYDYVSFGYYCELAPNDAVFYFDRIVWGDQDESLASMMYAEDQDDAPPRAPGNLRVF